MAVAFAGLARTQEYLKQIVFGGNDGIVTTFAIVAGFQGAHAEVARNAMSIVPSKAMFWPVSALIRMARRRPWPRCYNSAASRQTIPRR